MISLFRSEQCSRRSSTELMRWSRRGRMEDECWWQSSRGSRTTGTPTWSTWSPPPTTASTTWRKEVSAHPAESVTRWVTLLINKLPMQILWHFQQTCVTCDIFNKDWLCVCCFRSRRVSTAATCCAVTAATPPGGREGRRGAGASSTGAATWSARSVWGTSRSPHATNTCHPTLPSFLLILHVIHSWTNHQHYCQYYRESLSLVLVALLCFCSDSLTVSSATFQVYCKYFITLSIQWACRPKSSVSTKKYPTDFIDLNVCN